MIMTIPVIHQPGDTEESVLKRVLEAMTPELRAQIVGVRVYTVTLVQRTNDARRQRSRRRRKHSPEAKA